MGILEGYMTNKAVSSHPIIRDLLRHLEGDNLPDFLKMASYDCDSGSPDGCDSYSEDYDCQISYSEETGD